MQYFIIRPFQDTQEVHFNDGTISYKLSIELFKQFEPNFSLPINIKQLDYYKGILHQTIHYNGTVESLDLDVEEYNTYISKIATYQELEQAIKDEEAAALLPQTLEAAKVKVIQDIYIEASRLLEQAVNKYSAAERDRWTIILSEAEAYKLSNNLNDAPNLVAQLLTRTGITDMNSTKFTTQLLALCDFIINNNTYLTKYSNHICGIRGKWVDTVKAFKQTKLETEKQAILRLLALDWKQGWELPN